MILDSGSESEDFSCSNELEGFVERFDDAAHIADVLPSKPMGPVGDPDLVADTDRLRWAIGASVRSR